MERKIGESFEYEGKTFKVKEGEKGSCHGCFFNKRCILPVIKMAGECAANCRKDNKGVVFVEVHEQPQDEQPHELNLCEMLKYCPQGETFWSPMLGDVKLCYIDIEAKHVTVTIKIGVTWDINANGTITIDDVTSEEIMLYPSREQRDWNKFTAPWLKKEKFDPKTLNPFDEVLVRDYCNTEWGCDIFSHIKQEDSFHYMCIGSGWKCCIPYNDETKHLVGTTDEAPEYYKYWED